MEVNTTRLESLNSLPFYIADRINRLIPQGLTNKTFETFKSNAANKTAFDKSRDFMKSDRSLYLFGNVGCGKTHLLVSAFRECILNNVSATMINVAKMLHIQREEYETREEAELKFVETLTKGDSWKSPYKAIFFDDMSAENTTGHTAEILYLLLNEIIEIGTARVFITSNKSLKYISENISDRVASRISGLCGKDNIIKIEGEDWRLK